MRPWLVLSAALLGGVAGTGVAQQAAAACDNPPLVVIPKQDNYSRRDEKKINSATNDYFKAVHDYVACLKNELDAAGGDNAPTLYKSLITKRAQYALAEEQAVQKWYETRLGKQQPEGPPQHK